MLTLILLMIFSLILVGITAGGPVASSMPPLISGGIYGKAAKVFFALVMAPFLISLSISCWQQFSVSRRNSLCMGVEPDCEVASELSLEHLRLILRKKGYLLVRSDASSAWFVKNLWGHWGGFLLHLGILVALISSLIFAALEKKGVLMMHEGEAREMGTPFDSWNVGLFAGKFLIPATVELEEVSPEYRDNGSLQALRSRIILKRDGGRTERLMVAPNQSRYLSEFSVYGMSLYGHDFLLELKDAGGSQQRKVLRLNAPKDGRSPSYGNLETDRLNRLLKAKYVIPPKGEDSPRERGISLVLRMIEDGNILGELTLRNGEKGMLGTTEVSLLGVRKWTGVIIDAGKGMVSVLAGFLLIIAGTIFIYCAVPRGITAKKTDNGYILGWRVYSRYASAFQHEYQTIRMRIKDGKQDEH